MSECCPYNSGIPYLEVDNLMKRAVFFVLLWATCLYLTACNPPAKNGTESVESASATATISKPTQTQQAEATSTATPMHESSPISEETQKTGAFTSHDETIFTLVQDEPVIQRVIPGDEDLRFIAPGAVVVHEGQFHMLRGGFQRWPGPSEVAYFTSPDGIAWTRAKEPPVLTSAEVPFAEPGTMGHTATISEEGKWSLYFHTFKNDFSPGFIGRASSPDPQGLWRVDPEPVLRPGSAGSWDDLRFVRPQVIQTEEGLVMFYAAFNKANGNGMIGRATSTDGITWTKYDDPDTKEPLFAESDPVLRPFGSWDGDSLSRPAVVLTQEGWVMLYQGGQAYGLAFSEDGIHWEPYVGNPILTGEQAPGNRGSMFQAALVHHEGTYYLYLEVGNRSGAEIYLLTHEGNLNPGAFAYPPEQDTLPMKDSASFRTPEEVFVETLVEELPAATGGLTVDREGNIYVADIGPAPKRDGETVYKITPDGMVSVFASGEGLKGASGNAFDSQGNLYQSNFSTNRIVKITPGGEISTFVTEGLSGPVGIAIDQQDNLYVANCRGRTIQKVTPTGESSVFARSSLLRCPNGITMDEDGNLYVANFSNGNVLKVTPEGEVMTLAEIPGRNNGHIIYAGGGILYVVSRGGHQIYQVDLAGEAEPLAGTGERGSEDGSGVEATFSLPNGIGISPSGEVLYVNQVVQATGSANHPSAVRMIRLLGE